MKKVLIIGKDSYIGKHLKNHLLHQGSQFAVNPISSNTETWKILNLRVYDCVIYLAESDLDCSDEEYESRSIYYNCDLVAEIAEEAKKCGVKRFVYMSTIEIFGETCYAGNDVTITKDTVPNPQNVYSYTKLEGEKRLKEMEDNYFKIITLRLPLLYGPGCGGLYDMMTNILLSSNKVPVINNKLSVLNIYTLCSFITYLLTHDYSGTFHPQNKVLMSTSDLFKIISKELLIPLKFSKFLGWKYRKFVNSCPEEFKPIMGSLIYSKDIDL